MNFCLLFPLCIWINYRVAHGICNVSCKLYILCLFPFICTECLLRIVPSNYFFPILWECCAIKMPMFSICVSMYCMFSFTESKGKGEKSWKKVWEKGGGVLLLDSAVDMTTYSGLYLFRRHCIKATSQASCETTGLALIQWSSSKFVFLHISD